MNKKLLFLGGAIIAALLGIFILVFFQPQKLFLDDVVEEERPPSIEISLPDMMGPKDPFEASPTTTAATPSQEQPEASESTTTTQPKPQTLKGAFGSLEHPTSGYAEVIPVSTTERILRLEDFKTDNGPDLFVYLTNAPANGSQPFNQDFVNLGRLKGNVGGQNYTIPEDVDLTKYSTVVIWCERFTSAFGAAKMAPQ
jgi:hypothetical protein